MRLTYRTIVIAILLLLFGSAIFPTKEKLKLGKDLAGGTTLVYGILPDKDGNAPSRAVVDQIISVIRQRIDPSGIYDISIVAQGTNQIEITMPAPTPEVREKRAAFEDALTNLVSTSLEASEVEAALRLESEARSEKIAELVAGIDQRQVIFDDLVLRYDEMQRTLEQYKAKEASRREALAPFYEAEKTAKTRTDSAMDLAMQAGADRGRLTLTDPMTDREAIGKIVDQIVVDVPGIGPLVWGYIDARDILEIAEETTIEAERDWFKELEPIEIAALDANKAFDLARKRVLETSINGEDFRRVLRMDQTRPKIRDRKTQNIVEMDSPRELALNRLEVTVPVLADEIEAVTVLFDDFQSVSQGFDDPKELISLLRGSGVLSFRISANEEDPLPISALRSELKERGPRHVQSSSQVRWFPLDKLEQWYSDPRQIESIQSDPYSYFRSRFGAIVDVFDGEYYMLLYATGDRALDYTAGDWDLSGASSTVDSYGRPAVLFQMDSSGAKKLGALTGGNVGRQMAIVLDDRVYSAPTLQSRIGSSGQITGEFSQKDISYLLRVLNAGSLQSQLHGPIAQSTIGPSLGADNLSRGLEAGILALTIVAIFMLIYYFFAGVVANVALCCNAIFILGAMSLYEAAFTMPGIAGIVLTFGMAVDANVLIYERIREELDSGADLKTAIRLGYEKVLSTILDANVTNLIVCFVLGLAATAEVKGFGLTLGIGIVSTLICALVITRVVFEFYAHVLNMERLPMLPSVWRTLHDLLNPSIKWVELRSITWTVSTVVVIAAVLLTASKWDEMLDTVFKGGTAVTITFGDDDQGNPIKKPRAEVEEQIKTFAQTAFDSQEINEDVYRDLIGASVVNYNVDQTDGDGFIGQQFVIKTTLIDTESMTVEDLVSSVFRGQLNIKETINFDFAEEDSADFAPLYPILSDSLGENINDPTVITDVRRFVGGVAIVLNNLQPATSTEAIEDRIDRLRQSEEYKAYFGRHTEVIGLRSAQLKDRDENAVWHDVVVLVESTNIDIFTQRSDWDTNVAGKEWDIIRHALTQPQSLDQVTRIGSEVAAQFRAKAIVAITLSILGILAYIWVRFGSFRYSIAAIVALIHDVAVTLGLLALTHVLYGSAIGRVLLIEPFQIDLGVIAALLTIIGYSLNDTIVILDRVRENRGKLAVTSAEVVNRSINQCMSRTLLTSGTTLLAVTIMYFEGGTGIRPFTFAMLCGVVVGTYSSVGVAAPMVFSRKVTTENTAD